MKIGRSFTLAAAGILGIGLMLSLPAYADHHEGMKKGSSMVEEGDTAEGSGSGHGISGNAKTGRYREAALLKLIPAPAHIWREGDTVVTEPALVIVR